MSFLNPRISRVAAGLAVLSAFAVAPMAAQAADTDNRHPDRRLPDQHGPGDHAVHRDALRRQPDEERGSRRVERHRRHRQQ
jgi:hypothetical protein